MPFVSVSAVGGPHDDASYAAGYECGSIDARLEVLAGCYPLACTVMTINLSQLDLIAMKNRYEMTFSPVRGDDGREYPDYAFATFIPASTE